MNWRQLTGVNSLRGCRETTDRLGVPPSGGLQRSIGLAPRERGTPNFRSPVHPNPCRNRIPGTRARCASPLSDLFVPDIASRYSMANRSNIRCSHAAPDCDEYNSASPSNADLNASRVRPRGKKLSDRVSALSHSKRAKCGHAANPARAANVQSPALRPARDNDSATRTTQTSRPRAPQMQPAGRAKNDPYVPGCGRCNDDVQNTLRKSKIADVRSSAGAAGNATDSRAAFAMRATLRAASH